MRGPAGPRGEGTAGGGTGSDLLTIFEKELSRVKAESKEPVEVRGRRSKT
jgi:hypothetical protein